MNRATEPIDLARARQQRAWDALWAWLTGPLEPESTDMEVNDETVSGDKEFLDEQTA